MQCQIAVYASLQERKHPQYQIAVKATVQDALRQHEALALQSSVAHGVTLPAAKARSRQVAAQSRCKARAHPGGRCTTTEYTPGDPSTAAMGTVSTHRVNEPHRCTCCGTREHGFAPHTLGAARAGGEVPCQHNPPLRCRPVALLLQMQLPSASRVPATKDAKRVREAQTSRQSPSQRERAERRATARAATPHVSVPSKLPAAYRASAQVRHQHTCLASARGGGQVALAVSLRVCLQGHNLVRSAITHTHNHLLRGALFPTIGPRRQRN